MAASVSAREAASALRGLKQHDTNKRPRVGEQQTQQEDVASEIAAVAASNAQLQARVAALRRRSALREADTQQLLLGLGALNAVAAELAALQREHQARAQRDAALLQQSLAQLQRCSAQVDALRRGRARSALQLQSCRRECAQQMSRLVAALAALADGAAPPQPQREQEHEEHADGRRQLQQLKREVRAYSAQVTQGDKDAAPTTDRVEAALDELHAEMLQLQQSLEQQNQAFRRRLEELVAQQMSRIREVQDNETERLHEEMDELRSAMCGILKDLHRLKERTKYLVPSMARVAPRMSRCSAHGPPPLHASALGVALEDERRGSACTPTAIPQSTGYSITMATRQCQDELPHYEHGCDDDCYCPGVTAMPSRAEGLYVRPDQPRSSRSSNSSAGRSDDDNWRMISPEDAPATGQRAVQPCQSPHYSSRSSSLSDRLSVYGEEHVVPNDEPSAEQSEQRLLEQHRLFWIGEGAG
ncbi:GPI ethanolamine phosphate transferase 1 [Phytophthora cinnamomi]|uniref:GPI ethanolamine phosphate transferase 1 n=1 Tax=Phytophthora cinnamomi TaxID=4785 RepID=UPI00355AC337|nr:GPI ethanolamine phosphate transferase 1 [Phytophthora cinnamomi]